MARRSTTTSATKSATVDSTVAVNCEAEVAEVKEVKTKVEKIVEEPLENDEDIEVVNLIPNVSYLDNKTGDLYEWGEVGHIEFLTYETIKNMWRNYKSYFKNLWLKPKDERVIKKLGLKNTYEKYEFLMDESNYTRDNIDELTKFISEINNGLKFSVCTLVKDLVVNGDLSDVYVIRTLEKQLDLDLISFL